MQNYLDEFKYVHIHLCGFQDTQSTHIVSLNDESVPTNSQIENITTEDSEIKSVGLNVFLFKYENTITMQILLCSRCSNHLFGALEDRPPEMG